MIYTGFLGVTFLKRRYADLGYLLPYYLGPAIKNPVHRLFFLARLSTI